MPDDLRIRPATADDAQAVLEIYAPVVRDTAITFEEEPPSVAEIERRIERSHAWLIAERDGTVAGYAYATQFHPRSAYRWSTEVSVYLAEGARGRGVGKRVVAELLDRLRELGYVNAFAGAALPNPASVALFESLGFEKIAHWADAGFKLGAWHDVGWWQLRLQPAAVPPPALES